jgi:hypothetical protein
MGSQRNGSSGSILAGVILIGLGVLFLVARLFNSLPWQSLWPWTVIGVGGCLLVAMLVSGRSAAGLAVPGTIITTIGALLLYQNITGNWASWAYAWALFPAAVGLGILIMGARTGDEEQRRSGLRLARMGLVLFVVFGAFFELMVFGRASAGIRQVAFPVLLILVGLYLLARRLGPTPVRSVSPTPPAAPPAPSANRRAVDLDPRS